MESKKKQRRIRVASMSTSSPDGLDEDEHSGYSFKKIESPFQEFGKVIFLIFIWLFIIFFLTSTPEKRIDKFQIVVPVDEPKIYNLPHLPYGNLIQFSIDAPFLPNQRTLFKKSSNKTFYDKHRQNSMTLFLRTEKNVILTPGKTFYVHEVDKIDLVNASNVEVTFDITEDNFEELNDDDVIQVVLYSNFSHAESNEKCEIPIMISTDYSPINKQIGLLFASLTLILLYVCIIWEVSKRIR
jgi:hypothetical protein